MEISNIGNNYYAVHIGWDCDSNEYNTWDFVGEFNGRGAMNYTGCIKNNHVYNNKGGENITTVYTNGTGWLEWFERSKVSTIDVDFKLVEDMTGLEHFPFVKVLRM
jgi:hypothetical protein